MLFPHKTKINIYNVHSINSHRVDSNHIHIHNIHLLFTHKQLNKGSVSVSSCYNNIIVIKGIGSFLLCRWLWNWIPLTVLEAAGLRCALLPLPEVEGWWSCSVTLKYSSVTVKIILIIFSPAAQAFCLLVFLVRILTSSLKEFHLEKRKIYSV